jgi:hypothetical protein
MFATDRNATIICSYAISVMQRALEVQRQRRSRPVQKFAVLFCMVANWRATADEDGRYCFAVAL